MFIHAYKLGSASAKVLAGALGIKRTSKLRNKADTINWGVGNQALTLSINTGAAVALASDKIASLNAMRNDGVPTIEFTTEQAVAQQWYDEGHVVFCRTLTRASGGRGIVIADKENNSPVVPARLYTKYFKNKEEYRVHVGVINRATKECTIIFGQQKKRQRENDQINSRIRNHENGWVFCTEGVELPPAVSSAAREAVLSLGLEFGAVDVGYRVRSGNAAVFEVNTAPGITGKTVEAYAKFFRGS